MKANTAVQKNDEFEVTENFAELFEASVKDGAPTEGSVVKGTVTVIANGFITIDVGLKSEGRIPVKEFGHGDKATELKIGDKIDVYLERYENKYGEAQLSREKALREEAWERLEKFSESGERVDGVIFGRVKGGFTVDLGGAVAFLPGSQVDIRPVRDVSPLMNISQPFQILKMDRKRGNIVVSRRAVLEESRLKDRASLLENVTEGQVLEGVVKNITDYGAFIDMGGIDGLLHVTDISWKRINHPSEVLSLGQTVEVKVTKFDPETKRISLGMKQLESNPWETIGVKYPVGSRITGHVTNITDYGAFVEIEPGIEGLVHVSEMSWTKKNVHPSKIVSTSQSVTVQVLDIDPAKHRISLGIKQCEANPWNSFADKFKVGDEIQGEIKNITDFGLFVGLSGDIDGLVHHSDISWSESGEAAIKQFAKGGTVKAKILAIDVDKERISLGIKQLGDNPSAADLGTLNKNDTVTCTVSKVQEDGIEVKIADNLVAFIKKSDLSRDRQEQRPDRFAVGDRVDAKVTGLDKASGKVTVSVKALEVENQKKAIAEYGSTDSGASLGDILGAALSEAGQEKTEKKKTSKKSS